VTPQSSAELQLVAIHLGDEPGRWIDERRNTDPETSWRVIAYELASAINGVRLPSEPTIRRWHKQWLDAEAQRAKAEQLGGAA